MENAETLNVWLEALVDTNLIYLRHHRDTPALYKAGVHYARTDDWDPIPRLYEVGYHGTDSPDSRVPRHFGIFGDCKSLSCARVAELRMKGKVAKPVFRFAEKPFTAANGQQGTRMLYHILVQTGIQSYEDPSKECGMTDNEWSYM